MSFFSKKKSKPVYKPQFKVTQSESSSSLEAYREMRKEQRKPSVLIVDATPIFYSYHGEVFDFSETPVARYIVDGRNVDRYMLGGANHKYFRDSVYKLNELLATTSSIAEVPSFELRMTDIAFAPTWRVLPNNMDWVVTHMVPQPLTSTGKVPKCALVVEVETISGEQRARLKYDQDDRLFRGDVFVNTDDREIFTLTFKGGEIIRIMRNTNGENFPIFSA